MGQIGEIQPHVAATPVKVPRPVPVQTDGLTRLGSVVDQVDISQDARRLAGMADEIRYDKVEAARAAIERGHYDQDDIIDKTVKRLLDDL